LCGRGKKQGHDSAVPVSERQLMVVVVVMVLFGGEARRVANVLDGDVGQTAHPGGGVGLLALVQVGGDGVHQVYQFGAEFRRARDD
jgi:hypothetical protein